MQTPVFHVWDFNPRIEVRFADQFIDRIRNMTTLKRIHIQDKRATQRCGWRKPHRRDFYMEKRIKLIAFREGHPHHKIAERLYAKTDWHGCDRPIVPHRPFITIKEFHTLHQVTQIPLEEMEANIIEVRNWWAGHREIPMKFPVKANKDWAWLFGYWFSSGSLITRTRLSTGKRHEGFLTEEKSVRLRVDMKVFEEKLKPILSRVAYMPEIINVWYMKHGGHKIDRNKRKGVGNTPRKVIFLVRPIREIMEKFGLPTESRNQRNKRGCRIPSRRFKLIIPDWILESKENMHNFVEGYINGSQIGSWFHKAEGETHLSKGMEIRLAGEDEQQALDFLGALEEYLTSLGITGSFHILPKYTSPFFWFGYHIFSKSSLSKTYETFDIRKPDLRARLTLNYFMNALLYEACKELKSSEILVLGALVEKQMTTEDIIEAFRFRPEIVTEAINKMLNLHLAVKQGNKWRIRPTGYRNYLVKVLWAKERARRQKLVAGSQKFFSRCTSCGNVIEYNYQGSCSCGGHYKPVTRYEIMKKTTGRGFVNDIEKVSNLTIPVMKQP